MLDFPDAPVDGDTHIEEGQVWTYHEPPGVWAVGDTTGDLTTIVTADVTDKNGSWQIWGDTLIQWGRVGTASDGYGTITYPKEFKDLPAVVVTPYWKDANVNTTFDTVGETTTGTEVYVEDNTSGTPIQMNNNLRWIAIGPALAADKLPKEVPVSSSGGGGSDAFQPTGEWWYHGANKDVTQGSGTGTRVDYGANGSKITSWGPDLGDLVSWNGSTIATVNVAGLYKLTYKTLLRSMNTSGARLRLDTSIYNDTDGWGMGQTVDNVYIRNLANVDYGAGGGETIKRFEAGNRFSQYVALNSEDGSSISLRLRDICSLIIERIGD